MSFFPCLLSKSIQKLDSMSNKGPHACLRQPTQFFLLSLMSDRSGLGPGKYTDQLQSTACSNCPIGSYADTWLGRIFTQTSLQLFTHFCTFANTKNLLDSDFSANPKGFRLWDCFVARGQAYRNATLVLQAVRPFLRQGTKDFELFALNLDTESIGTW